MYFTSGHACHEDIIHSASDGTTVDIEGPTIVIIDIGLTGIESDNGTTRSLDILDRDEVIYQTQYGPIELQWNVTDETSDVANLTWMAGRVPYMDDVHTETETMDDKVSSTYIVDASPIVFAIYK